VRATRRLVDLHRAFLRRRYAWLFASLLVTLGGYPLFQLAGLEGNPVEVLLAATLAAALFGAAGDREARRVLAVGALFAAARVAQALLGGKALMTLSQSLWVLAALVVIAVAVRHAFQAGAIDSERIFAALDAYLLAGFGFAICYWLLQHHAPGSLGGALGGFELGGAVYFSFVTLATLGYGDVVPVSAPARGLAIVEAVGGQLYVAVLVARLVSLHVQHAATRDR
jgi:hypothetical protein